MKYTIDRAKKSAELYGGKCLSTSCDNALSVMEWTCSLGHKWTSKARNVISHGKWCPKCKQLSDRKYTIDDAIKIASERDGLFLSSTFSTIRETYTWKCNSCGKVWRATFKSIKNGTWCPTCGKNTADRKKRDAAMIKSKPERDKIEKDIIGHGWKILSRSGSDLTVQCQNGHVFETKYYILKRGNGCKECVKICYTMENISRVIVESIFEDKFPQRFPRWLLGIKGKKLQLDGYNERLKIAFEYQGEQHFNVHPFFHKNIKNFEDQKRNDEIKVQECNENGIALIVIPYTVDVNNLQDFILSKYKEITGIEISHKEIEIKIHTSKLDEIKTIAIQHGGICLSNVYINANTRMQFRCKDGHEWFAFPTNVIFRGSWCPRCSRGSFA